MKTMTASAFKVQFSKIIKDADPGETIAITFGKQKELVGYFIPGSKTKTQKRRIGILDGKAKTVFRDDFKMTEEEFLGL